MAKKLHPWIDFIYSGRFRIADRSSRLVKMTPTWIQNDCLMDWNRVLLSQNHLRELILKPRQVKISTIVSAFIVAACMSEQNLSAIIGNLDQNQKEKLWEQKYRTLCGRMVDPVTGEDIEVPFENYSLDRIKFKDTGSSIYNEIHSMDLGRGATLQIAHLTEFPFWENGNPEAILKELMCSIPDGYPTCVFIESTAAKDGDWFEKTFRKSWAAQKKRSGIQPYWAARFYAWFQNEEYQVARVTAEMIAEIRETLTEEEQFLMDNMHGISDRDVVAKLIWRRQQLENQDEGTFRKNFPSNVDDAFRSKRESVFDHNALDWYSRRRTNPIHQARIELDVTTKVPDLIPEASGPLHIWESPKSGHDYVVACDVGNEGSLDKNRSYTAAVVVDRDEARVVATWQAMINPWDFAECAYALARYYNTAELVIEKAAGGVTTLSRCVNDLGYGRVYAHNAYGSGEDAFGFSTNMKTRPMILDYLRRCVRHHIIEIPCTRTQREMEGLREDDKGKIKAPKGATDDLVLSLAMACWVAKNENWVPRTKPLEERQEVRREAPRSRVMMVGNLDEDLKGVRKRSPFRKYYMGA